MVPTPAKQAVRWCRSVLAIVCLATGAAVTYGVVNDQFLAHLSVQYFTIGHIDYLHIGRPEILAFEWGFLGTWWVGLTLGIVIALAASVGPAPRLSTEDFVSPLLLLVGLMAVAAATAWLAAYALASGGTAQIAGVVRPGVSPDQRVLYYADFWANIAGYIIGPLGALTILVWSGWRRLVLRRLAVPRPQHPLWRQRLAGGLVTTGALALLFATVLIAVHRMPVFS